MTTGVMKAALFASVLALPFTQSGCSVRQEALGSPPAVVKMQREFNYSEHEPFAQTGTHGIKGEGFIHHHGLKASTCAGSRVLLLPGTPYFHEMIGHIVGGREPEPPATPFPSLKNMIRRTRCDAQGGFSFSKIPDGDWFILTEVNGAAGGGVLIGKVTLSEAGTTQVVLTDKHLVPR